MSKLFPHSLIGIVSVLPALLVMPAIAETITERQENIIDYDTYNLSDIQALNIDSSDEWGGVYFFKNTTSVTIDNSEFSGNVADTSGALELRNGVMTINDSSFSGNHALTSSGAIETHTAGTEESNQLKINRSYFTNNYAPTYGAVSFFGKAGIHEVNGSHFVTNHANSTLEGPDGDGDKGDGGAIYLGSEAKLKITGTEFTGNTATSDGGAIATRNTQQSNATSALTILDSTFTSNTAGRTGGAIYANVWHDVTGESYVTIDGSKFISNSARDGGAIYNDAITEKIGNIVLSNSSFTGNTATQYGGAVYNTGTLTVNGGSSFTGNTATAERGGAIYNTGTLNINGTADNYITFDSNTARVGGAVSASIGATTNIDYAKFTNNSSTGWVGAVDSKGILTINHSEFIGNNGGAYWGAVMSGSDAVSADIRNTTFKNNTAGEVGAVSLCSTDNTLVNVHFIGNKATSTDAGADGTGALFLGSVSATGIGNSLTGSEFTNNESALAAGALGTRTFKAGNNKDAKLDINNTTFTGNKAATVGGAIDNYIYGSAIAGHTDAAFIKDSSFTSNSAANGGAVYNHKGVIGDKLKTSGTQTAESAPENVQVGNMYFTGATFTGNTATTSGGAIYNEGTLTFAGENTFSGNTANGVANDIYNAGTLTFAADSATKMDGGINGNGALTVASGAVLDLGTASIQQGTLTLDGTINATLLNATKFASFDVADFGASAGDLNLTLKSVGTYNVFKNAVFNTGSVNIADSSVFTYNWNDAGDTITVTTKSVDEIVAATDVKAEAANAVVTLTNAKDETAKQIGEILSTALADGNNEYVEQETKKLAPEDKSVAHSVASNVQNQVLTLTANRMSGGIAAGRAGGDEINADYGVWMQGLLNKSRYAGQFDGNSRGFAIGADALINKVFTVGLGYAFSNADVSMSHDGGDMDIDSHTVFVYGQYKPNQWFINATLSNTISKYNEKVKVAGLPVETDYDVNAFGIQALTGYDFKSGLTPMVGTRYLHVSTDGHDRLIGHVSDASSSFLSMVGGAKYAFDIHTAGEVSFMPELHAMLTYDVISDKNEATVYVPGGSVYHVAGDRLSRVGGEFGLGLTTEWRGLELSVNYDLALHKDYTSHTGMLKLRYEF